MKVLLTSDVAKLGWLGDVVEVTSGYARNYLLPQGLATVPNEASLKAIAQEKAKRSEQRLQERKHIEKAAAAVDGKEAVLAAKANEQGVLFGSVSASEIAANLREQGYEVADEIVQLPEHIKHTGTHSVSLRFADDLTATVSVVVVADQQQPTEPSEEQPAEPSEEETETQDDSSQIEELEPDHDQDF
jgi:large subunit ribosomal protein L9